MISSTIRRRRSSASTGNMTSTRRSKFRGIQSALDRNTCCFVPFAEHQDAAVFEEAVDDAADADVFRDARQPRPQAADAADHQVDRHAGLAGAVEGLDRAAVDDRVELGEDPRLLALPGPLGLLVDQLDRPALAGPAARRPASATRASASSR